MKALRSEVLIEMECNLTVRARAQPMPGLFKLPLDRLMAVEFAVGDYLTTTVFSCDGLSAGHEINDA